MLQKQRELEAEERQKEELEKIKRKAQEDKENEKKAMEGMFSAATNNNLPNFLKPPTPVKAKKD